MMDANVVKDANPGSDGLRFRRLLKEIDNGIGVREMDKLRYLCQDLGVAPRKLEEMERGIQLFAELEKLALISPNDISLLTALMKSINRFDLVRKLKAWSTREGRLAGQLSEYRKLMLIISDSLSKDEREQLRFFLSDSHHSLPVSVMEESKTLLQLFTQMEKYTMISREDISLLLNIISEIGNQAIVKELKNYQRQSSMVSTSSSDPGMYPSNQATTGYNSTTGGYHPAATGYNSVAAGYNPAATGYNLERGNWSNTSEQPQPLQYSNWQQQYRQHSSHPQQVNQQPAQTFSAQNSLLLQHEQQREMLLKREQESGEFSLQQEKELARQQQQQHDATALSNSVQPSSLSSSVKPQWYIEAKDKYGEEHADSLWEKFLSLSHEELEKRMEDLQITKNEAAEDEMDEEEARNLQVQQIVETTEDQTTRTTETKLGSAAGEQTQKLVVPAQTATVTIQPPPYVARDVMPKYSMNRLPRGLCIIFNAKKFESSSGLEERLGTDKDVEVLQNTFMNNLKFSIHVKDNPTSQDYIKLLHEIQGMDHSGFDAFVCIILSHGSKGYVYGSDGKKVSIDAITNIFRGEYVPTLVGKPKLFFIQACQGSEGQTGVVIQQDAVTTVPNEADTLVSLSTVPGYASNRSPSHGTWFITSLCDVLNRYHKSEDILSMLTLVNHILSNAADKEQRKQIGNPSYTLRKLLYFSGGLD